MNLGIGSDRTQHVIWRLNNGNLHRIKPKVAVISRHQQFRQQYLPGSRRRYGSHCETTAQKLPDTKVLLLGIFPRGANNADKRRQVNEGTNAIFKKLADSEAALPRHRP